MGQQAVAAADKVLRLADSAGRKLVLRAKKTYKPVRNQMAKSLGGPMDAFGVNKAMTPGGKKALLNIINPVYAGETDMRLVSAGRGAKALKPRLRIKRLNRQRAASLKAISG